MALKGSYTDETTGICCPKAYVNLIIRSHRRGPDKEGILRHMIKGEARIFVTETEYLDGKEPASSATVLFSPLTNNFLADGYSALKMSPKFSAMDDC